jgi:hypothetical protein
MVGRRTRFGLLALVLGALALAACDREYFYAPAVAGNASVVGRPAAYARIPPEAPRGDVSVATIGITPAIPASDEDGRIDLRAVHLRMVVAHDDDGPWTVDTREQRLVLPGKRESRPVYAASDRGERPVVEVPAGGRREIDLFYALPDNLDTGGELAAFDLLWTVQTDRRFVVMRAPFEKVTLEGWRDVYDYREVYYHGGYGWSPVEGGWGAAYQDPWNHRGALVGPHVGGHPTGGGGWAPRVVRDAGPRRP